MSPLPGVEAVEPHEEPRVPIGLYRPAAVLHSHDVPGYKYRSDWIWNVPAATEPNSMALWLLALANHKDKAIKSVVINCHGSPGHLHIGKGIGVSALAPFLQLKGTGLEFVWIVACEVAAPGIGLAPGGDEGAYFMSQMATTLGAKVMASDRLQHVNTPWVRRHHIDLYEGKVYTYSQSGSLTDLGLRKPNWMRWIERHP